MRKNLLTSLYTFITFRKVFELILKTLCLVLNATRAPFNTNRHYLSTNFYLLSLSKTFQFLTKISRNITLFPTLSLLSFLKKKFKKNKMTKSFSRQ